MRTSVCAATLLLWYATTGMAGPARAEIVVIVSAKSPLASLTNGQVAEIYLGNDNRFAPVDLPEDTSLREEFYRKVAGKTANQVKLLWTKLIFTGVAVPPKVVASPMDVKSKVAASSKAIGYLDRTAVDSTVKIVLVVP